MKLEVEVSRYLAWTPRLKSEVKEGDRVMQSDLHPDLVRRQEVVDEPSRTLIEMGDSEWAAIHADHVAAMKASGGAILSRRRVLARHLQAVMAEHTPAGGVVKVHLLADEFRSEDERKALEKYLNSQLVEDEE